MSATVAMNNPYDHENIKWRRMIALSIIMHVLIISSLFLVPYNSNGGLDVKDVVYEVDLVDLPEATLKKEATEEHKALTSIKSSRAKRIYTQQKAANPVIIARRTIFKKTSRHKNNELTSNQLLEKAISMIKNNVKTDNSDYLEKAISELDKKTESYQQKPGISDSGGNAELRLYQMEVETWIKSHWSYPVAMGNQNSPEAIIVLKVKQDGTIIESRFQKRSNNMAFDKSVLQAIERSKTVPPFPEGLNEKYEEIEINFNLKDIE